MYFVIHKLPIFVPMINILIIEDQPMFRDSIATQLDMQPDFQVTGKVASYGDGIQFIKEHPETDIVVMEPGNFITADYSVSRTRTLRLFCFPRIRYRLLWLDLSIQVRRVWFPSKMKWTTSFPAFALSNPESFIYQRVSRKWLSTC